MLSVPIDAFFFFDRIYCIRSKGKGLASPFDARAVALGIGDRVRDISLDPRIVDSHVSVALAHRRLLEESVRAAASRVLVFDESALLRVDAAAHVQRIVSDLKSLEGRGDRWSVLCLGAATWGVAEESLPGCDYLVSCPGMSGAYALAYHRNAMERLLQVLPAGIPQLGDWTEKHETFDRFLLTLPDRLLARPRIASLPGLLPYEDPATREAFLD